MDIIKTWLNEEISKRKSKSEIVLMPANLKSVNFAMMDEEKGLGTELLAQQTMVVQLIDFLLENPNPK